MSEPEPCPHGVSPANDCDDCAAARRAEKRRETESLRADYERDLAKDEPIDFPERGGHE